MSRKEDLFNLTIDELNKKKNVIRTLMATLIGILVILTGAAVTLTIMQGYHVFSVLPIVFAPAVVIARRRLASVNEELGRRK